MRVAYINTVAGFNATGRLCEQLASANDVDGIIYYGRKTYDGNIQATKFNNIIGNGIHVISTFLFDNHAYVNQYATKKLIRLLEEFKPHIIHLHNLHGYYLHVGLLFDYIRANNIKVVWTFHDCWPITGHCAHFDGVKCNKWKTECFNCPILENYPPTFNGRNTKYNYFRKKETFSGVQHMVLVSPSKWLAMQLKQSYLSSYPIEVINNGIDFNRFKYLNCKRSSCLELLAVASVWTKMKGLDDLIQFSHILPNTMHLTVIGVTAKQSKQFPATVTCLQRTNNQEELIELYNKSDFFLNFTYEDTFPTVNIEALACGLPIITYNTGGSPEIIDEKSGFVIEVGCFKEALSILKKGRVLNPMNCIDRAKIFSQKNMIDAYLHLYKKIMGNG